MIFRPDLARKVLAGEKTVTRRLTSSNPSSPWWERRCSLGVGSLASVQLGRGKPSIGRVRIVGVRLEPLGRVTDEEARLEGFADAPAFFVAWRALHDGSTDAATRVWRVEFEVADG